MGFHSDIFFLLRNPCFIPELLKPHRHGIQGAQARTAMASGPTVRASLSGGIFLVKETTELFTWKTAAQYDVDDDDDDDGFYTDNDGFITVINYSY